ncbi:MAG: hypothetical protein SGI92_18820 [Bryobacteraceae bacterium]|nr:hypothetical protein [Bryobacteraceae bacterium]
MPKNWNEYLTTLRTSTAELWPAALRREFARGSVKWGYGVMW